VETTPKAASLAQIKAIATRAKLDDSFVVAQMEREATEEQVREAALDILASASGPRAIVVPGMPATAGDAVQAMSAAIMHRSGSRDAAIIAQAGPYQGATLRDMAADLFEMQTGRRARGMTPDALFRQVFASATVGMQTTSDFGTVLNNAARGIALAGAAEVSQEWRQIARTVNFDDFRPQEVASGYDTPDLQEVIEHEEITYGAISRVVANIKLKSFAKGFAFSRQAIINNDLANFTGQAAEYGRMAARSLAKRVWRVFLEGTTAAFTMRDGKVFLHADHNNIAAGAALTAASLAAAEQQMVEQAAIPGQPLGIVPRFLIVGPGQRGAALDLMGTSTFVVNGATIQNRFRNLEVIYEPSFGKAWALVADPAARPTIVVPLLGGRQDPNVDTEQHFETFGVKVRVWLDYEAAPADWNGVVYNPGPA
jgi:hypothetical protein